MPWQMKMKYDIIFHFHFAAQNDKMKNDIIFHFHFAAQNDEMIMAYGQLSTPLLEAKPSAPAVAPQNPSRFPAVSRRFQGLHA